MDRCRGRRYLEVGLWHRTGMLGRMGEVAWSLAWVGGKGGRTCNLDRLGQMVLLCLVGVGQGDRHKINLVTTGSWQCHKESLKCAVQGPNPR